MQIISIFLLTLSAFSRRRYQFSDESYAGNNLLEWQYSDNYNAENNQEYFDSYPRISAYQAAHMPKPAGPPPGKGARPPSHAAGHHDDHAHSHGAHPMTPPSTPPPTNRARPKDLPPVKEAWADPAHAHAAHTDHAHSHADHSHGAHTDHAHSHADHSHGAHLPADPAHGQTDGKFKKAGKAVIALAKDRPLAVGACIAGVTALACPPTAPVALPIAGALSAADTIVQMKRKHDQGASNKEVAVAGALGLAGAVGAVVGLPQLETVIPAAAAIGTQTAVAVTNMAHNAVQRHKDGTTLTQNGVVAGALEAGSIGLTAAGFGSSNPAVKSSMDSVSNLASINQAANDPRKVHPAYQDDDDEDYEDFQDFDFEGDDDFQDFKGDEDFEEFEGDDNED